MNQIKFNMVLETNAELDRLYIEVVKCRVKEKYSIVKDIRVTDDGLRCKLIVSFKKDTIDVFSKEYFDIRFFIEGLYSAGTWFGDLTYIESIKGRKL